MKKRECRGSRSMSRDYDPMTKIFREVIAHMLKSVAQTFWRMSVPLH
jgi:hypothetical protein